MVIMAVVAFHAEVMGMRIATARVDPGPGLIPGKDPPAAIRRYPR